MFTCENCNKQFKYNYLLKRHINKKIKCNLIQNDIIIEENNEIINIDIKIKETLEEINKTEKYINDTMEKSMTDIKCNFCNKIFSNKSNLSRHTKMYCSLYKEYIDTLNNLNTSHNDLQINRDKILNNLINIKRDNEMKQMRTHIAKLLKKQSANINITNNKITNNKITNNNLVVNINAFGKENLSHITTNDYKKYLSGLFSGFIKFIEKVHFDENMPENHNICITNLKSKYICVYDDCGKWITKDKNETIDRFIDKKYNLLVDKLDEMEEKKEIDENILKNFLRFTENYKDVDAQKNTKNEIMLMIYNNKNKVNMK